MALGKYWGEIRIENENVEITYPFLLSIIILGIHPSNIKKKPNTKAIHLIITQTNFATVVL